MPNERISITTEPNTLFSITNKVVAMRFKTEVYATPSSSATVVDTTFYFRPEAGLTHGQLEEIARTGKRHLHELVLPCLKMPPVMGGRPVEEKAFREFNAKLVALAGPCTIGERESNAFLMCRFNRPIHAIH
ncbi:MAG: hypothetical protein DI628_04260 [Blastochloris viridis]|uniref:Uncharacterized protein n=1 Tax=Blastochloris viridis TaxID=1079 RepID=A0A6N4R653_BLAVI|nr:MAG: hypothetical protein DI628_04260 [Blastochloris viridis]